jgi:hypothetical protein
MLRTALLAAGALLIAGAVLASFVHVEAAIPLAFAGAVLVLAILFEHHVYKPAEPGPPGPNWRPTRERFIDPSSGETVEVFTNPRTGERRYVSRGAGKRE